MDKFSKELDKYARKVDLNNMQITLAEKIVGYGKENQNGVR